MNYMNKLPIELQMYIFEFDSSFKEMYSSVLKDLNDKFQWYWYQQNVAEESFISTLQYRAWNVDDEYEYLKRRTFSRWYFNKFCPINTFKTTRLNHHHQSQIPS